MLGLTQVIFAIFAADITFLIALVVITREIKKVKESEDCKELLEHENPLSWVKACAKYFLFSVLSSLAYILLNVENIGIGQTVINFFLYSSVISFLFGLIFIARIIWFVVEPESTANILAGKILKNFAKYGSKVLSALFIAIIQFFNVLLLCAILNNILVFHREVHIFTIVYLPTLILSLIVTPSRLYDELFHYEEEMRRRDWISLFCFYSPWFVLWLFSILNPAGIAF